MTRFIDTPEAGAFIASADSRETSPAIMRAIAFFARNADEAVKIWEGDWEGICTLTDIWEHATCNGLHPADRYCWGAAGHRWFESN